MVGVALRGVVPPSVAVRAPLAPPALGAGPQVALDVGLAVAGRAEAEVTEGALEGLGAGVQAHVHFQAAFGGEGRVAHVAAKQLLTCRHDTTSELNAHAQNAGGAFLCGTLENELPLVLGRLGFGR